jgi:hypothetical protein
MLLKCVELAQDTICITLNLATLVGDLTPDRS